MRYIDTYARNKRDPERRRVHRPAPARDHGVDLLGDPVPGAVDADRQGDRRLHGPAGRQPAQGDRQEGPREDGHACATASSRARARRGTAEKVIEELWAVNEAAADYSFNKSHAACYALISYRTAWLKANYPAEYMAALISSVMSTKDKVPFFVSRCEEMGIDVLPPDVNESGHDFVVTEGAIRFGLDAVKNVGRRRGRRDASRRASEAGPFTSIWDFCERVDCRAVNKKAIESLVRCGAFDTLHGSSHRDAGDPAVRRRAPGQKAQQDALLGQGSIFDFDEPAPGGGGRQPVRRAARTRPCLHLDDDPKERNVMEKETLGLFLSSHPLKEVRPALRAKTDCTLAELDDKKDGDWVTVGGMIAECKKIRTKKGDMMMFATLDDLEAQVEIDHLQLHARRRTRTSSTSTRW